VDVLGSYSSAAGYPMRTTSGNVNNTADENGHEWWDTYEITNSVLDLQYRVLADNFECVSSKDGPVVGIQESRGILLHSHWIFRFPGISELIRTCDFKKDCM
jgi:hypothetical protein